MFRVIFLDIDGPLVNYRIHLSKYKEGCINHDMYDWDEEFCKVLFNVCVCNDVKIVISSTWRKSVMNSLLHEKLKLYNLEEFLFTNDQYTDILHTERGYEIKAWLDRHVEDVYDYIILDDDSDMLEDQMPHLLKCSFDDGMTPDLLDKFLQWERTTRI